MGSSHGIWPPLFRIYGPKMAFKNAIEFSKLETSKNICFNGWTGNAIDGAMWTRSDNCMGLISAKCNCSYHLYIMKYCIYTDSDFFSPYEYINARALMQIHV